MTNKVKETAKRTAKAKRPKPVKLKKTTLRMLRWAHLLRALNRYGRVSYAQNYREARRCGCSNRYIMGIDRYPTPEAKKQAEELEAEYAALAERAAACEATADSAANEADTAPDEDSQPTELAEFVVDEPASVSSSPRTPRPRSPRSVPKQRQNQFSFGSD